MDQWVLEASQYATLMRGLRLTAQLLLVSFVVGVALSLVFGVARLSEREWVRGVALVYVEFARGISSVILLFIMATALPILLEVRANPGTRFLLATLALGINMGGYGAEIVRGAIQSIPKGQAEASIALNLSPFQRLRHVVLPQAMRVILPPMGNLTIEILKGTALVSLIGLTDLMQQTRNLISRQLAEGVAGVTVLFLNVLIFYFIASQIIAALFRLGERRLESRFEQRTGRQAVRVPEGVA